MVEIKPLEWAGQKRSCGTCLAERDRRKHARISRHMSVRWKGGCSWLLLKMLSFVQ